MARTISISIAALAIGMSASAAQAEGQFIAYATSSIAKAFKENGNLEGGSYKVCGSAHFYDVEESFNALGAKIFYVESEESQLKSLVGSGICDISVFEAGSAEAEKMRSGNSKFVFEF